MAVSVIRTKPEFLDVRGGITRVLDEKEFSFKVVLRITSKKGTIRSNHYHLKDSHYLYIESGECEYSEKPRHTKNAKITTVTLHAGDLVFTPPGVIHAVKFTKDTVLYAFSTQTRAHASYEKDTRRVSIVT